tara:strand:+ start:11079 stop:11408 length:330 start_codon:yes stop_codon:yes gene_type:complete
MKVVNDGRSDYQKFHEEIQNAVIRFSMYDPDNDVYRIGRSTASVVRRSTLNPLITDRDEYYVVYEFTAADTSQAGTFQGEFRIDFLDECGILIAPIRDELYIHILESNY